MLNKTKTDIYRRASEKYIPDKIKVLFIAESPPAPYINGDRSYIYFDTAKKPAESFDIDFFNNYGYVASVDGRIFIVDFN